MATPNSAPASAPTNPIAAACTTYRASTWRLVAPRQRNTATVSILADTNALTPLATPIPPNSSAISPMMLRKSASRTTASVKSRSVSATVRTRTRVRGAGEVRPFRAESAVIAPVATVTGGVGATGGVACTVSATSADWAPRVFPRARRASFASCSAAVRGSMRRRSDRANCAAALFAASDDGSRNTASYSARLPNLSSPVDSIHLSEM